MSRRAAAVAGWGLMLCVTLAGCVEPAESGEPSEKGGAAPEAAFPAALSSEVIGAFRSLESGSRRETHLELFARLVGLLESKEYVTRDFDDLAKRYRLDRRKFGQSENEVFLTRARDGEPAVIVRLSQIDEKSGKSVFSAQVIWVAYGGHERERRAKAEEIRNDLQDWWALYDPFRSS